MRSLIALVAVATLAAGQARADFVNLGVPSHYAPGTPFAVNLGLSPAANVGLYNVELVFRTNGPVAGLLSFDAPLAAATGYVFPTPDNFLASPVVSGTDYRLTFSDFTLGSTGTAISAGVNDRITTLTVRPAAGLVGPIAVFIDRTSLQIDDPDGASLLGPGTPPAADVSQAVPAPAGIVFGLIALGTLACRRLIVNR